MFRFSPSRFYVVLSSLGNESINYFVHNIAGTFVSQKGKYKWKEKGKIFSYRDSFKVSGQSCPWNHPTSPKISGVQQSIKLQWKWARSKVKGVFSVIYITMFCRMSGFSESSERYLNLIKYILVVVFHLLDCLKWKDQHGCEGGLIRDLCKKTCKLCGKLHEVDKS